MDEHVLNKTITNLHTLIIPLVWGITIDQNLHKVQRLHNCVARVITNNFDYDNIRAIDLIHQFGWTEIKQSSKYFEFKYIHGTALPHSLM